MHHYTRVWRLAASTGLLLLFSECACAGPEVISSGGGVATGAGVTGSLSIGQPIVGMTTSPPVTASFGFWYGASGCPADFNGSGGAPTVQDIFDFLSAWFAQDPRANFNGASGVTVQDVFDFLTAFFSPCA